MASRLEKLPPPNYMNRNRYPWSDWEDGSAWLALADEDYADTSHKSFRSILYKRATESGLSVVTRNHLDAEGTLVGVAFQFTPNEENA